MTDEARKKSDEPGALARILGRFSVPEDALKLSSNTAVYGVGKMCEGIAALILIPVLTRAFSPAEFGVWDVAMTFFLLATTAASLGLEPALAAFYFETKDAGRRKLVTSTSLQFRLISSIALAALIFFLAPRISLMIFQTPEHGVYFKIVAVAVPFFLSVSIFKQLLRLDFAPWRFNVVGVGYAGLYAGLAVFLVVGMNMGVVGALLGILVSAAVFSVIGAVFTARHFSLNFSRKLLGEMLRFGLPLAPALFACWVIDFSDRLFLTRMGTLEQVGVYSVGARISSIIILFSASFQMAWGPYALSIQSEDDAKDRYSRGLLFFVLAALAGGVAITLFARPILVLLTQPKYYEAEKVIGPLTLATIAYGAYLITNIGLLITKKTMLASVSIIVGAGLNAVLNFLLIPRFGMMGAAMATLAAYVTAFALLYLFAQRNYPVEYRLPRMITAGALAACVMAVGYAVRFESSAILDFTFRIALLAGFTLCLLRFFVPRQTEGRIE